MGQHQAHSYSLILMISGSMTILNFRLHLISNCFSTLKNVAQVCGVSPYFDNEISNLKVVSCELSLHFTGLQQVRGYFVGNLAFYFSELKGNNPSKFDVNAIIKAAAMIGCVVSWLVAARLRWFSVDDNRASLP